MAVKPFVLLFRQNCSSFSDFDTSTPHAATFCEHISDLVAIPTLMEKSCLNPSESSSESV